MKKGMYIAALAMIAMVSSNYIEARKPKFESLSYTDQKHITNVRKNIEKFLKDLSDRYVVDEDGLRFEAPGESYQFYLDVANKLQGELNEQLEAKGYKVKDYMQRYYISEVEGKKAFLQDRLSEEGQPTKGKRARPTTKKSRK